MTTAASILFTSAGRRVELIRAFRKALRKLDVEPRLVATEMTQLAPASQVVDDLVIVPATESRDWISQILQVCQDYSIDVVFPLIDPDIPVLAGRHREFAEIGTKLAVCHPDAAAVCGDKLKTRDALIRLGVPTADVWSAGSQTWQAADFPLFIRPRKGSAGQHSYRVDNPDELHFFSKYVPDPIVQRYLEGPEVTTDVVADLNGEILSIVSRQRLEIRAGEVAKGVTIHDREISSYCKEIASQLRLVGPSNIQCMRHRNEVFFTEVNLRFGGGVPLALAAGAPLIESLMARVLDIPFEVPELGSYEGGVYMTRFDDAFFLRSPEETLQT